MPNLLIDSKTQAPRRAGEDIARPHLVAALEGGLAAGALLTLVCAPAGYGKSTLVAEWLATTSRRTDLPAHVAWLALDEEDDHPLRFLAYVAAALNRVVPDSADSLTGVTAAHDIPPTGELAGALIHDLARAAALARAERRPGVLLVLDDYHRVRHRSIHDLLQRCLDRLPPHCHLVVISRSDPPFALSRLRAQGSLTEIRSQDLRFTVAEATEFLNHVMQLDLPPAWIEALSTRTEGWIAGLHLAALSLRARPADTRGDFIRAFSGSHRYVFDYLAEEVLSHQSDSLRHFLAQTAILDRFCAPLCDAVTGRTDSADLLRQLEQGNLFLIALDDERRWFRYHHLFADYLRTTTPAAQRHAAALQAAHWCETQGLALEAIGYAFAQDNLDVAADILERLIQSASAWSGGDMATLVARVESLPATILRARPRLSLHASRAYYLAGHMAQSAQMLDQAEAALAAAPALPDAPRLAALAGIYRGTLAAQRGDAQAALDLAGAALRRLSPDDTHARARALDTLAQAYELTGEIDQAIAHYTQAADLAQAAGVAYLAINAACEAALVSLWSGDLMHAETLCRHALERAASAIPPTGLAWSILGEVARERNELDAAAQMLHTGVTLSQRGGLSEDHQWGLLFLARLHLARGDTAAAWSEMSRVDRILRSYGAERYTRLAAVYQAEFYLRTGQIDLAREWAYQAETISPLPSITSLREVEALTLGHFQILTAAPHRALPLLRSIIADAAPARRFRTVVAAHILAGRAADALGDAHQATSDLATAVHHAAALGLRRIFIDYGPVPTPLLHRVQAHAPSVIDAILELAPGSSRHTTALSTTADHGPALAKLSEQERTVLRLICAGHTNQQIADSLVITVGTAKWHVHNVLQKLGVRNRSQAIAAAHTLNLD